MEQIGQPEHEGEKYLRLLGLDHLAGQEISTGNGVIQARDFLEICGEHALPYLVGFESMSPEDPRYDAMKGALQKSISQYIGIETAGAEQ